VGQTVNKAEKAAKTAAAVQGSDFSSPVLTVQQMAGYLQVPVISCRLLIRRGKVRHQRVGIRFLVPRADVDAYLAANWRLSGSKGLTGQVRNK
jgi:excisionase family DNA binding protein